MTRYYQINWDLLNELPAAERMAALADINTGIRTVTGAERRRMVDRAVAEHGSQAAAARHLGISPARINQIIKENLMSVEITPCTRPAELYRRYDGQTGPQPCFIELDTRDGAMRADYDAEIGNAVPASVWHGLVRRYPIPALSAEAANRVMEEIRPLAERIVTDTEEHWDGNNHVARMGADALAAEEEIQRLLGCDDDAEPVLFDATDEVTVWYLDGATNGQEAEEFEIGPETTDERLDEIAEEIRSNLEGSSEGGVVILDDEVVQYLYQLRDDAIEADHEDVFWSVVEGTGPASRAVDPEPAGITIPTEVLSWAEGHGFSTDNPDVYLLVATEDDAEDIDGEIDWMKTRVRTAEANKIRAALAARDAERGETADA
ncbi:helix-turn-helix domain-containing protein [Streptomonospora nanhaiensis]|uniref:helix-turn-helix domain-containing protein n=1 Tax=Streptomonospora nanhaiensis TaxID=1323731 RepID=UPI001C3828CE|nr:LysR family transcriptional regulator [Streptomonospora nanhaiensis]MBV2364245.1 LysR family transcriptional regulator [Streptomonospora nanhaiensis]